MRRTRRLASTLIPLALAAGLARGDDDATPRDDARVRRAQIPGGTPPTPPTPRPTTPPTPRPPSTSTPDLPPLPGQPGAPTSTATPGTTPAPGSQPLAAATPTTPAAAPPSAASALADLQAADLETSFVPPIFIGDQAPLGFRTFATTSGPQAPPTPNPRVPPTPPVPGSSRNRGSTSLPWIRGFKIAENQSPRPQDRFFFSFNYYDNLNGVANAHLGSPLRDIQVYRELFGFEKTFLDGNASVGLRMPLDSLTATGPLGGGSTSVGNLTAFSKLILWQDQKAGNLISGGLAVTAPNAPSNFAGFNRNTVGFHDSQIQPFVGYIWTKGKFYIQGFEAIDVPTDPHDVTEFYTDIGMGYRLYTSPDPNAWLRGIIPTFETHVNNPLSHRGAYRFNDPAGTPDVVDLTFGTNFLVGKNSTLTVAYINPVTGPRPFNMEWAVLLNVYFGRTARRGLTSPPVIGQ